MTLGNERLNRVIGSGFAELGMLITASLPFGEDVVAVTFHRSRGYA
jgi:hypothetical protein